MAALIFALVVPTLRKVREGWGTELGWECRQVQKAGSPAFGRIRAIWTRRCRNSR